MVIQKGNASNAQGITDELIEWSRKNRVVLNPDKCKELRISFARNPEAFDPVSIDDEVEVVNSAKLLGITISDNLTWNAHVNEVVKKASKKLYFLVQLKRARLPPSDIVLSYLSCVRSTVDYGVRRVGRGGAMGANAPPPPHESKRSAWNELIRLKKCELMKKNAKGGPLLENIPEG